jgi:hypothetical protein
MKELIIVDRIAFLLQNLERVNLLLYVDQIY